MDAVLGSVISTMIKLASEQHVLLTEGKNIDRFFVKLVIVLLNLPECAVQSSSVQVVLWRALLLLPSGLELFNHWDGTPERWLIIVRE